MNKKAIVMPVLATLMLFLLIGIASACSCVYLENTKAKLDNAAYVFSGEVTNIDISENKMQQVTVRIINSYKPSSFPEPVNLMIYAVRDSGSECGYNFQVGEKEIKELNNITNSTSNNQEPNTNNQNNNQNQEEQNIFSKIFSWLKSLFS